MRRRQFLNQSGKSAAALGAGIIASNLSLNAMPPAFPQKNSKSEDELVQDETFWSGIRNFFTLPADFINLENGYFSPQPISTLYFHQNREKFINTHSSFYMRTMQMDSIEKSRKALAKFLSVKPEELALTRNTTESLNIVISGYPWKKGDEVIIGNQDYGSMVAAFRQAGFRNGIKIKVAQVPLHPKDDSEIVNAYLGLATKKTKLIHVTHLINITGHVLPVKKIVSAAHEKGIEVVVDAAHSIAQIQCNISEWNADYVAASLHKWLCCPLGNGFLWMKGAHIPKIWPLMGDSDFPITRIEKFEHQGTRATQSIESIVPAIDFQNEIGSSLKEKRLKYLMKLWCSEAEKIKKIHILNPWNNDMKNSAIATFSVDGFTPGNVAKILMDKHKIFTVAIDHEVIKGVRITPHIFTLKSDIDSLVAAIAKEFG